MRDLRLRELSAKKNKKRRVMFATLHLETKHACSCVHTLETLPIPSLPLHIDSYRCRMLTDPGEMEELMSKLVNNAGDPGLEASLCLHFVSK